MVRILLVALLGLSLTAVAQSDDPKPAPESKPPWQRPLTGADAAKATDLNERIAALEAAANDGEALRLREELLTLRTRLRGARHWETLNAKWDLAAAKTVAALPADKRAGWRQAALGAAAARRLEQQAQYGKALPLWQERLKWSFEVLGEEHPHTGASCTNVAVNLQAQGKVAEAGPLFQKALDICRKVLGEDHPNTATCYHNIAFNLNVQGKYAEAEPFYRKALDIRCKVLGEEHPDTATSYIGVAANLDAQRKHSEAGPLYRKALDIHRKLLGENHPLTARTYLHLATNLNAQGKYPEAGTLYATALDIHRKLLGENHPITAKCYRSVAINLTAQGKYGEAGPLFQKALDTCRKVLGDDHPDTAASCNGVAFNLNAQGKYGEAGPLFLKALDIRRKLLGEDHPDTATSCYTLADNLKAQGKYAEAGTLYQKALDIHRKVLGEDHPETSRSCSNIARNLEAQGKHAEAGPLFQKALDIRRKLLGEDHPDTVTGCDDLASNLNRQGKYAEAELLSRKALDISRKVLGEDHPNMAASYFNVADNLNAQGKYAEGGPLVQKALDIRRKVLGEDHPATVVSYLTVAASLLAQEKYPEALASLETAARSYEAARLSVTTAGLERAAFGVTHSPYPLLAAARSQAGRPADAWAALEADLARGLLDEVGQRRALGLTPAEQRQRDDLRAGRAEWEARVLALVSRPQRTGDEAAELERLLAQRQQREEALAKLAVAASRRELAALNQLQAALPPDAAFVAWVDVAALSWGVQEHWGFVVRPQGDPHWERLPGSGPGRQWTPEDSALPGQLRAALTQSTAATDVAALAKKWHAQRLAPLAQHLDGVKRLFVPPVNQMAGIPLEALTDQYTVGYIPSCTYLARLKGRERPGGRGLLAVGDPVFPPLRENPQPTALPSGGLLITQVLPGSAAANARLQAGDVLVAYAGQDLTSFELLGKLIAANAAEKAVAVKVWREGQERLAERELAPGRLGVALAKEPARKAITARRQADQLLAKISRGERYGELPGTQVEIARLAELFDARDVTTLTRAAASEQRLDELRRADALKQFRYLHLATHGQANNVQAFESALLLTPPPRLPEVRVGEPYLEGRLTAGEVLEYWRLDCELVTLSACESGLGRHGGGDGLLGFAQAFLMAGSRSVCLTLWQVDDTATALLMDRFYRNLLGKRAPGGKPLAKAAALREAKDWLRTVTASEALERLGALTQGVVRGERPAREEMQAVPKPKDAAKDYRPYAHPRYWAAFILIGDPE